jgi:CheY-like chemotaxis protein/anti-sigma regulatory factor (Ser/Thr protein kinase)
MTVRVLLVEDDPDLRMVLRTELKLRGRADVVGEARTGGEAVDLAAALEPDVMVLDLGLPDVTPRELLAGVRRTCPTAGIVMFSGAVTDRAWFELRSDGYVSKGSNLDRLLDLVESVGTERPTDRAVVDLPETLLAPKEARDAIREVLARWGYDEIIEDASLVVSELVGNAVEHARTGSVVVINRSEGGLRIEVTDHGDADPVPEAPGADAERGRGLMIVSALETAWGVHHGPRSKSVWVELSDDGPA